MALRNGLRRAGVKLQGQPLCAALPSSRGEGNNGRPVSFFSAEVTPNHDLKFGKPTLETAKALPREYHEFSNSVLVSAAFRGDFGARKERMIREVMAADGGSYLDARAKVKEMSVANRAANGLYRLPYYTGVTLALGGGFASIPLCFDIDTAMWFNENFVTTDVADPEDLETPLEVVRVFVCVKTSRPRLR